LPDFSSKILPGKSNIGTKKNPHKKHLRGQKGAGMVHSQKMVLTTGKILYNRTRGGVTWVGMVMDIDGFCLVVGRCARVGVLPQIKILGVYFSMSATMVVRPGGYRELSGTGKGDLFVHYKS
jgi:hypothetical protein